MAPISNSVTVGQTNFEVRSIDLRTVVPQEQNGGMVRTLDGIRQLLGTVGQATISILDEGSKMTIDGHRAATWELLEITAGLETWLTLHKNNTINIEELHQKKIIVYPPPSGAAIDTRTGLPFDQGTRIDLGDYCDVKAFVQRVQSFIEQPNQNIQPTAAEIRERLGF
jgi:hypothetical protein